MSEPLAGLRGGAPAAGLTVWSGIILFFGSGGSQPLQTEVRRSTMRARIALPIGMMESSKL